MSNISERDVIEGEIINADPMPGTHVMVAVPKPANPYMVLAEKAMDTGKVDQLDRLLDLQLRWDAEQARKAFVGAMADFKGEPMEILKRKQVSFTTRDGDTTSYNHAELSDVTDAIIPAMSKNGLSHSWNVKQSSGKIEVTCVITHRDGHSGEPVTLEAAPDASGKKNAIQQIASAVTYLQRYTLLLATGMATKGMDDDGRASETKAEVRIISFDQAKILSDLVDAYVINKGKFMDWVRDTCRDDTIEELAHIPESHYKRVHDQLAAIRNQRIKDQDNG